MSTERSKLEINPQESHKKQNKTSFPTSFWYNVFNFILGEYGTRLPLDAVRLTVLQVSGDSNTQIYCPGTNNQELIPKKTPYKINITIKELIVRVEEVS